MAWALGPSTGRSEWGRPGLNLPKGERTPMLEQYLAIKQQYKDAILFYRMGDFYEMFYEDAQVASEALGLRLTSRAHGKSAKVPLAGFPYHQLDSYLTRMVDSGHRVVIVEQVEDPKLAKGLVKRDVVRIATAGTNPAAVDRDEPTVQRIAALIKRDERWGYAWANVATGEFQTGEFTDDELSFISGRIDPVELVVPESEPNVGPKPGGRTAQPMVSKLPDWVWETAFARKTLVDHFQTVGLKGFGIDARPLAISAAGALFYYLKGNLRTEVNHLTALSLAEASGRLYMEPSTRHNLELVESLTGNPRATLFSIIDHTVTVPGKRLLYNRLLEPLADKSLIDERLDSVAELKNKTELRRELHTILKRAGDLQRYLARLATARGSARDLVSIRETLEVLPELSETLNGVKSVLLQSLSGCIHPLAELKSALNEALVENPPLSTSEGDMIRDAYDRKLDELRELRDNGKSWLEKYERQQRTRTGIGNLKVGYNRVFGYYIEVTKSHLDKIPDDYTRRQTLVGAERFITAELSDFENRVLGAEDEMSKLEAKIYQRLVAETLTHSVDLMENARVLAELDVIAGLAELAERENYCRPTIEDCLGISLKDSRHPVVEKMLPLGESFVPNDLEIDCADDFIMILTGPNMAGKSTYLRQVALIVILAQMGSFVPACQARIGMVDKLFTRIGALDNLAGGESTFLVEMHETASILNNATNRSLVLFDEIGRGTSTFDGLSLAWAIVEYLHHNPRLRPRTLFATHYHELVDLERYLEGVVNRNVAVREYEDKVVFLRRIVPGGCDRSFGIHVAQMAGLPQEVVNRAREVLVNLEANDINPAGGEKDGRQEQNKSPQKRAKGRSEILPRPHIAQLSLFDPIERKLRQLLEGADPEQLSPLEALKLLVEIKKIL